MSKLTEKVAKALPYVVFASNATETQEAFLFRCLKELGILDDEVSYDILMNDCKEGDARAVFCDKNGLPVPRFRKIWAILKEGSAEETSATVANDFGKLVDALKPVSQWTDEDLLSKYGVQCESAVETELKSRSKGNNCIVFLPKADGFVVDVKVSMALLKEARRRQVPASYHTGGKVYRVYPVGEFPEMVYIKCPVTGCDLFDGYSDKLGFKWEMDYDALVFIYLVAKSGVEITPMVARDLQKEWKANDIDGLRDMFPKVANEYDDLKEINELPSLKTRMSVREKSKQDPFGNKRW